MISLITKSTINAANVVYSTNYPANISASDQRCFNIVDQR